MLYKFKSKNAGDVILLEANGRQILEIIGKSPGPQGIILPEQIPAAIQALEAAVAREVAQLKKAAKEELPGVHAEAIGLQQRAKPFIDILRSSQRAGTEVVWGV